jgi:hypothetical protein
LSLHNAVLTRGKEFSVSEARRGGLSGERDHQNRPVLAVRELDAERTDEQLLQQGSQGAFAGTYNGDILKAPWAAPASDGPSGRSPATRPGHWASSRNPRTLPWLYGDDPEGLLGSRMLAPHGIEV